MNRRQNAVQLAVGMRSGFAWVVGGGERAYLP